MSEDFTPFVLTYGDLFNFNPVYPGQRPTAKQNARGDNTPIYSTGRLEKLFCKGRGENVYVVCGSKDELDPYDAWWRVAVPRNRVFLAPDRFALRDHELQSNLFEQLVYPWKMLFIVLWSKMRKEVSKGDDPTNLKTVDEVKKCLSRVFNVVYGDTLPCWDAAHPPTPAEESILKRS